MLLGIPSVWYFIVGIAFIGFAVTNPYKKSAMIVALIGIALFAYGTVSLYGGQAT